MEQEEAPFPGMVPWIMAIISTLPGLADQECSLDQTQVGKSLVLRQTTPRENMVPHSSQQLPLQADTWLSLHLCRH